MMKKWVRYREEIRLSDKKKKNMLKREILIIMIGVLGFIFHSAFGYVIDGSLSDWGIDLTGADKKGYLDKHLPSGGWDIDYTTEDNADKSDGLQEVGPGWSYKNYFDAESIYFDNDQFYIYIVVVGGLSKYGYEYKGYKYKPGDIGIDLDLDGSYEYVIDVTTSKLYQNPTWEDVLFWSEANPWRRKPRTGTSLGSIDFSYSTLQNSHYVLEAKVPLILLNLSANPGDPVYKLNIHWTMECGNDYLKLSADINPVPEPTTLLFLTSGLLGLGGLRKLKKAYVPK